MTGQREVLQTTKDIAVAQLLSAAHVEMNNLEQLPEPMSKTRGDNSEAVKDVPKWLLPSSDLNFRSTVHGSDSTDLFLCVELPLASIQQMPNLQHHIQMIATNPAGDETKEHTRRHKKMKKVTGGCCLISVIVISFLSIPAFNIYIEHVESEILRLTGIWSCGSSMDAPGCTGSN